MLPLLPILLPKQILGSGPGETGEPCHGQNSLLQPARLAAEQPGHLFAGHCVNEPDFSLHVEQVGRDAIAEEEGAKGEAEALPPQAESVPQWGPIPSL